MKSSSSSRQSKHKSSQQKLGNPWLRRCLLFVGAIAALYFLWMAVISIFVEKVPAACIDHPEVSSDGKFYEINPSIVVIEPWRGQHHSYALFAVPQRYSDKFDGEGALVKINGSDSIIYATVANPHLYRAIAVPKDHVIFVSYLWTHEVIWQILQGKYDHLQYVCNWTAYFKTS
ncbi:hypothetical protein HCU40_12215 [Pseudanabaena biceps]|nr:hypothetical protein [Pseudanabaena biceps]